MFSTRKKALVRYTLPFILLACSVLLLSCSPIANPSKQILLVKNDVGSVGLDPATLKVNGGNISADIHFNLSEPFHAETIGAVTDMVWDATFSVPNRLLYRRNVLFYDSRRNSYLGAPGGGGYYYLEPGSANEEIMKALVDYCKSRGMAVDTEPAPFIKHGFHYLDSLGDVNNYFLRFFDPASVKLDADTLEFTLLGFHCQRNDYTIHTAFVDLPRREMRLGPGKRYNIRGIFLLDEAPVEWFDYPPTSILDKMIQKIIDYHVNQHNQPTN